MNSTKLIPTSVAKSKVHFQFIDALRGIACLWVVFFHANSDGRLTQLTSSLPAWVVTIVFNWGGLGVSIFFVLSGFVIAYSLREAKIDLAYWRSFNLRRFTRLSPPYYASILVVLAFGFLASYAKGEAFAPMHQPLSFERLLAHLFYLQDILRLTHINDVYWTLCLEIQFYVVFCTLLALAQWLDSKWNLRFSRAIVFVPAALLAALFPLGVFADNGRPFIFLPLWYGFLLGVFAYWSWRKDLQPKFFYLYSAVLLTGGVIQSSKFLIACVICAIAILEVARANRMMWLSWSWLQFLGKISYSLYLIHVPIMGAVFFLVSKRFPGKIEGEIFYLLLGTLICIASSAIMWQLVEKPSIKLSQKVKLVKNKEAISV
ncbi:acyltransferase [Calothrix sp. PCC 7507]|uniref:acyltransferase family protein n=1 Tax=Calothrix sp. PCC 7507 TaxID=99598 RepID=UPI00029F0A5F|nr:acyltransferase [Calothrix sp. PCC 7507]AFY35738.1 acyltransferase 3 [Calothrix sp. PCC 7507]